MDDSPIPNADQIAEWNGGSGVRWATYSDEIDQLCGPFGQAALELAQVQPGEHVLDLGCGCGSVSRELSLLVGPQGSVLGVDISQPMLEVARSQSLHCPNVTYLEGDASVVPLPDGFDLLFSRFGVMFFEDPIPAYRHLRLSLKQGGRVAFVCWATRTENVWADLPVVSAMEGLGVEVTRSPDGTPGPFGFSDPDRVTQILTSAGFAGVNYQRLSHPVYVGADPRSAAENLVRISPLARVAKEAGKERLPELLDVVSRAIQPYHTPDGVSLPGVAWVFGALNLSS